MFCWGELRLPLFPAGSSYVCHDIPRCQTLKNLNGGFSEGRRNWANLKVNLGRQETLGKLVFAACCRAPAPEVCLLATYQLCRAASLCSGLYSSVSASLICIQFFSSTRNSRVIFEEITGKEWETKPGVGWLCSWAVIQLTLPAFAPFPLCLGEVLSFWAGHLFLSDQKGNNKIHSELFFKPNASTS